MMKKNKLSREDLCEILAGSDGYLKRILAVIGARPDEQEEIAHQTILEAYEKLHRLREPEKLKSWLTTVAKRLYNRERARSSRLVYESDREYGMDIIENIASDDDILDELVRNEDREYITRLVLKLDSKDSSIILLRYKDGMSLKDIALALDLNYSTVRSMHTRALAKLKDIIESEKGGRDNGQQR